MRFNQKYISIILFLLCFICAYAQLDKNKPQIGYVYPAGARQGKTVQIMAGGQFLRGASDVYISGEGVSAKVIRHTRMINNLNGDQRKELQRQLKEVRNQRLLELPPKDRKALGYKETVFKKPEPAPEKEEKTEKEKNAAKLPNHPLFEDLENKSLKELAHIAYMTNFPRTKLQQNRQLAELAILEITVEPDARPGPRELRLRTRFGLTNPIAFQVGTLPEVYELEPNDESNTYMINNLFRPGKIKLIKDHIRQEPIDLPVVINGQVMPGDKDVFRFNAKTGQTLVIEAQARSLIPYLADAVPGWFQATVALYNAAGRELAFADDFRFNPDPVLYYEIPRDGIYKLEIRDSIYRGRQDFVYRVSIGPQPFITQMFPLGGKEGVETVAAVEGWNLAEKELKLDTKPGGLSIRKAVMYDGKTATNRVPYDVSALTEYTEKEDNNSIKKAEKTGLGKMINGRIDKAGDIDVFAFEGKAGDSIAAEVFARRLNSPLDSVLRLTDASGEVIDWNDDHVLKDVHLHKDSVGLMTHHADSYLMTRLPKAGTYYVHLTDSQNHGSSAHGYRLRLTKAQPDFELRVTPSSLRFNSPRQIMPVTIHVMRKDGFDGEIKMAIKETTSGFKLGGNTIPSGCQRICMTVTAPDKAPEGPVALEFEGTAKVNGQTMYRQAVAADDVMQAFLYRHLVPAEQFLAVVRKVKWAMPPVEVQGDEPIQISAGQTADVILKTPKRPNLKQMRLSLYQPPEGITLTDVKVVDAGLSFKLKAEKESVKADFQGNLIIEAFREHIPKDKEGKPTGKKRSDWMGVMPAVPVEVVCSR